MPISLAHDVHIRKGKRNPLSEYEMKLAEADDDVRSVLCCPFHCGQPDYPELDNMGWCEHLIGFTNCTRPDGTLLHSADGPIRKPEGAVVELISTDRDFLKRRKMANKTEPLLAGDYLIRVNGTTRRVYRETPKVEANPVFEPTAVVETPKAEPPAVKWEAVAKKAEKMTDAPAG